VNWEPVDLSAPQYARPSEPPVTLGLFYRGKRHAISGPPEAAKTLLALITGLEHMRAGEGQFALVDFEMGEHATRLMLAELGATTEEIAAVYYVAPDGPPDADDIAAMVAAGVTLVIIDAAAGAYECSALDDNKRADAEKFSRAWVRPLWQHGVATVLIDHVTKNPDGRGKFAIGSERKLGTVDVHLGLHAVRQLNRGGAGLIRISTHKDRPAHLRRPVAAEIELNSDPTTNVITWQLREASPAHADATDDGWRPTVLIDRVLEHLHRNPELTTRSALANAVRGKRAYVLQAIDHLLADGKLQQDGRQITLPPDVPVPGNVPRTYPEGNGNVPASTTGNEERERPTRRAASSAAEVAFSENPTREGTSS
jgi:hypothetical protein